MPCRGERSTVYRCAWSSKYSLQTTKNICVVVVAASSNAVTKTTKGLQMVKKSSQRISSSSLLLSILTMKIRHLLSMLSSIPLLLVSIMAAVPSSEAFTTSPELNKPLSSTQPSSDAFQKYIKAAQLLPAAYSHCLTHHHLATECVTAGCMAGIGDYLAQRKSAKSWSPKRSLHFVLKGFGEGIMWSIWYHKADRWVSLLTQTALTGGFLAPSMEAVYRTVLSVVLDLMIACPLIYGLWDIPFPALLSGTPLRMIPRQIKSKLGEMMLASFKLWTPVNILIYNSPLQYRVLLMSTADVFWQSIVSSIVSTREISNDEEKGHQQQPPALLGDPLQKQPTSPVPSTSSS